jgi:type VI secretion system protein ImpJ
MWNNKVVWSEGMFLQPQHFQQQDRYFEGMLEGRCAPLTPYPWGFTSLKLDEPLLRMGKIGLAHARGVLPDGTPFNFPNDTDCPEALDIPDQTRDEIVFLALPLRRPGMEEVIPENKGAGLARFCVRESETRDSTSGTEARALLRLGQPRTRLALQSEPLDAYTCLGLARIEKVDTDRLVVLDNSYVPPVLDAHVSSWLNAVIREIGGSLHARGNALAGISSGANQVSVAQLADFLLLQTVNRYEPLFAHLRAHHLLHPESLYRVCLMLAGDLATFREEKRCAAFEPYRHDDLAETFQPLIADIRKSLAQEIRRTAISIEIEKRRYGFWIAKVEDRLLLKTASFVLAVRAHRPPEHLRQRFPAVVQIGPNEQIGHLADHNLRGIRLHPLPAVPPAIPFHVGSSYFELDRSDELWKQLDTSGAIALHVAEDFPDLNLELWAIREQER